MSLLSTSFPEGVTVETEGTRLLNTSGATVPYGGIQQLDESSTGLHATTLKAYKTIAPTAAGLLGTTRGRFCVCVEPDGVANNAYGRFVFISDEVEVLMKASENIAIGNKIRPDHGGAGAADKYVGVNDAGSAVGEHFVAQAIAASNVGTQALVKCRFDGWNFMGFRTV